MPVFCSACGFRNREGADYCARCGASLRADEAADEGGDTQVMRTVAPASPSGDTTEAVAVPDAARREARAATLLVHQGGGREGERFAVDRDHATSLGRDPDSDIFFDDVTVSRKHAVLEPSPDGVWIRDLGSLNGTYVNRRRADRVLLEDGDEVQVGKYRLTFLDARS